MHRRPFNRREFLAACAALALCGPALAVAADEPVAYSPEAYQAALTSGTPLLLDFFAPW
jgi:hypothetical protein